MNAVHDPAVLERAANIRLLALDVDGVLTDGRLWFDQGGNEMKSFHARDGLGIRAVQRLGIIVALITGRKSRIVADRAAQLDIRHVFQGCDDKLNVLEALMSETDIPLEAVCYAGDDWIDVPVLARVGLAVAPADAANPVRERVHWVTRSGGGRGAVREICDVLLSAQASAQDIERLYLEP